MRAASSGSRGLAPEGEDADVGARHDVVGAAAEPDLDERRVLPRVGLRALDAGVERDHPAARDAVLEPAPRGVGERTRRQLASRWLARRRYQTTCSRLTRVLTPRE